MNNNNGRGGVEISTTTCEHYYCSQVSFQSLTPPVNNNNGRGGLGTETTPVNNNNGRGGLGTETTPVNNNNGRGGVVPDTTPVNIIIVHRCRFRD